MKGDAHRRTATFVILLSFFTIARLSFAGVLISFRRVNSRLGLLDIIYQCLDEVLTGSEGDD